MLLKKGLMININGRMTLCKRHSLGEPGIRGCEKCKYTVENSDRCLLSEIMHDISQIPCYTLLYRKHYFRKYLRGTIHIHYAYIFE